MPTVAEVLKQSGFDDAAIAAMDQRALAGFQTVLQTAEQQREAAETAQRATNQYFEETINPALNSWGVKETNLTAERDYYRTLALKAKDGGFIAEVPPFQEPNPTVNQPGNPNYNPNQPRNQAGQWQQTPGSPDFREFENKVGTALGTLSDITWKYQSLYGTVMPDAPTVLAAEAQAKRLPLAEYVAQKYDFAGKEKAIAEQKQREHDDAIRKAAVEERDRHWSERIGSNPNVRVAEPSRFADLTKGVQDGTRQDPLKMTPEQRRAATRTAINADRASSDQAA